jgi:hypothetical protein
MRAAVATVGLMLGFGAGLMALSRPTQSVDQHFNENISQYLALRRQVAQRTPGPHISSDRAEIGRAGDALADAIRAARPTATACDIFTPRVAADFLRLPCVVPADQGPRTKDQGPPLVPPIVNGRFDWGRANPTPPSLIAALPSLPDELQYRVVNCDLVLVDIVAGLVIDVVPRACPDRCGHHRGL